MTKKILLAVPPTLLHKVDLMARCESRTRSDLMREALRRYYEQFLQVHPSAVESLENAQCLSCRER